MVQKGQQNVHSLFQPLLPTLFNMIFSWRRECMVNLTVYLSFKMSKWRPPHPTRILTMHQQWTLCANSVVLSEQSDPVTVYQ